MGMAEAHVISRRSNEDSRPFARTRTGSRASSGARSKRASDLEDGVFIETPARRRRRRASWRRGGHAMGSLPRKPFPAGLTPAEAPPFRHARRDASAFSTGAPRPTRRARRGAGRRITERPRKCHDELPRRRRARRRRRRCSATSAKHARRARAAPRRRTSSVGVAPPGEQRQRVAASDGVAAAATAAARAASARAGVERPAPEFAAGPRGVRPSPGSGRACGAADARA